MKYYELACLISPDLSSEQLNALEEKIILLIQNEKGIYIDQIKTTKKNLAKALKGRERAILLSLDFQLNSENLENLEKKLKAEGQILRYLISSKKIPKITEASKKPLRFPEKVSPKAPQPKVELKEIEKKLEEILGE